MAENMSFLPEDYLEKKIARRTNVIFISLFAVVLTAVIAADFVARRQYDVKIEERAARTTEFEQMRRQFEQIEELNAKKQEMKNKANVTTTLKDNVLKSVVFAELINNMPATLRLTDLQLDTKIAKGSSPAPRTAVQREKLRQKATGQAEVKIVPTEVKINLVGLAQTDVEISDYIGNLNVHELFNDVSLSFVEESKKEDLVQRKFRIELKLDPNFDSTQFEPTLSGRGLDFDPTGNTLQINPEGEFVRPTEPLSAVETE